MTSLFLPASGVQYPVTVLSQYVPASAGSKHQPKPASLKQHAAQVRRGTPLFAYTYNRTVAIASTVKGKERSTEEIKETRVFESPIEGELSDWRVQEGALIRASTQVICTVTEPCTHPVQYEGLCALCGKITKDVHYTGFSDTSRASISMSHHHASLTVSQAEAERLEAQTTERLQKARKLSLIVDLDQTIIQATVDPTVGDWLADADNPNHHALEDVYKFQLSADGSQVKSPSTSAHDHNCWYYLKPRPGLSEFLKEASKKYEMHVYTMGTRSYAESVCEAIDPEGKLFGSRILTRDESGSLTQKSLNRLFPCDTSMVVIIDDRADVWGWSPNLLKVVPYDFFGVGDLNAAFLPKKSGLDSKAPEKSSKGKRKASAQKEESKPDESMPSEAEATAETTATIESQIADRPLAKQSAKAQDDHEHPAAAEGQDASPSADEDDHMQVAVLKNDDFELDRVSMLLQDVHDEFFRLFDAKHETADVKTIIPAMKHLVLQGCHLLFSSVIPLGAEQRSSEIWKLAESFGANCSTELSSKTTHVVAGKEGTSKVLTAQKRKGVHVVWTRWLIESMAQWQRQNEQDYLLKSSAQEKGRTEAMSEGWPHEAAMAIRNNEENGEAAAGSTTPKSLPDVDAPDLALNEDEEAEVDASVWDDVDAEMEAYLRENGEDISLSQIGTPRSKRSRSSTPSIPEAAETPKETPTLPQSPLRKRQKIAANRKSKLKQSIGGAGEDMPTPSAAGSDEDDDFLDSMAESMAANLAD